MRGYTCRRLRMHRRPHNSGCCSSGHRTSAFLHHVVACSYNDTACRDRGGRSTASAEISSYRPTFTSGRRGKRFYVVGRRDCGDYLRRRMDTQSELALGLRRVGSRVSAVPCKRDVHQFPVQFAVIAP
jgi:hypothetical protein